MPGLARIAGFVALLGVVFAVSLAVGSAIGPEPSEDEVDHATGSVPRGPRGLAVSAEDVSLELNTTRFEPGRSADLAFRVVDAAGMTVSDFEVEHERRMHVIVVRRDMTGYQHLHPEQAADGSWHVPLELREAGTYRVFADFQRHGDAITLGADVQAGGEYAPLELPHPSDLARTDGYEVALHSDGGDLEFEVRRDGRRVTDIAPYLGARGHLVALREGDLAYLHVHPEENRPAFGVEYPSSGRYRLFLQFKHDGSVHTAEFTQEVEDAGGH